MTSNDIVDYLAIVGFLGWVLAILLLWWLHWTKDPYENPFLALLSRLQLQVKKKLHQ